MPSRNLIPPLYHLTSFFSLDGLDRNGPKAGKKSYHCALCGLMCQSDDYRRDHNLERRDGLVRSEEVPTEDDTAICSLARAAVWCLC